MSDTPTITELLESEIEHWSYLGHPALMQRYVLQMGKPCIAQALPKTIGKGFARACFQQAYKLARRSKRYRYCEGYGFTPNVPFLVHHAWCIDSERRVIDPTWDDPALCQYYGVDMDIETVKEQTKITGCTSVFDGMGVNYRYMFATAPGLEEAVNALKEKRKVA